MKRDELRALGVPENAVDQVYELCRKHMAKLEKKLQSKYPAEQESIRRVIRQLINEIKDPTHLRKVLSQITYFYVKEYKEYDNKEVYQGNKETLKAIDE